MLAAIHGKAMVAMPAKQAALRSVLFGFVKFG
jgi:hypothetical protein